MRTVKVKHNTFNRPFGVIFFDLQDIDGFVCDSLQLCDSLDEAERVYFYRSSCRKEIVKVEG